MKISAFRSGFSFPSQSHIRSPTSKSPLLHPINSSYREQSSSSFPTSNLTRATTCSKKSAKVPTKTRKETKSLVLQTISKNQDLLQVSSNGDYSRFMVLGTVTIGLTMLLDGLGEHKALAFGPEGPLVEEFWDNVRRYGLYILTVGSGALYTIFLPIWELLKNPISAVLILVILGGGFYLVTQVVSAMIGINEFAYEYSY